MVIFENFKTVGPKSPLKLFLQTAEALADLKRDSHFMTNFIFATVNLIPAVLRKIWFSFGRTICSLPTTSFKFIGCTKPGEVLGLRTYGEVPLENLKSYPVPESDS